MRFAILYHDEVPAPHFDLLIETSADAPLATFRLGEWPIARPVEVIRQPDHRRIYLDYEGPISGNRGRVRRVAQGECELHVCTNRMLQVTLQTTPAPTHLVLQQVQRERWSCR